MRSLTEFITREIRNDKHHHLGCVYQYYEIAKGDDAEFFVFLRERVKNSYIDAGYLANVLKNEGFTGVAQLLEDKFPSENDLFGVRTGDFGEALTEILFEDVFNYSVPVKKMRYKTNRDKASFGIDVIAFKLAENEVDDRIVFSEIKASINKNYGIDEVIQEIDELAAYSDKGKQKIRSTIRFVSERLFSEGQLELETRISKFLEKKTIQRTSETFIPCLIRDIATWGHDAFDNKSFARVPLESTLVCVCALENFKKVMGEAYKIIEGLDDEVITEIPE